jgi:hypothetical protein
MVASARGLSSSGIDRRPFNSKVGCVNNNCLLFALHLLPNLLHILLLGLLWVFYLMLYFLYLLQVPAAKEDIPIFIINETRGIKVRNFSILNGGNIQSRGRIGILTKHGFGTKQVTARVKYRLRPRRADWGHTSA